jgi:thymidylate synthase ThyX
MFTIRMEVPYWVSVHYVRHKVGVEHYVRSQRNDRQHDYDRNAARQDVPVVHVMDLNAEALITIIQKRLCGKAAKETREVAKLIANEVLKVNPEFFDVLREPCLYNGYCHEMRPCGNGIAEVYR